MDNREQRMNETLRALADDDRTLAVSTEVEQAVMTRWDEHRAEAKPTTWLRSRPGRAVSWISVAAAAAVLALAVASMRQPAEPPAAPPEGIAESAGDRLSVTNGSPDANVFVQLGPITPHERNGSSLQLMRVQLRGDMLSRLGIGGHNVRASEVVEADVLLGEDGIARAIRFER